MTTPKPADLSTRAGAGYARRLGLRRPSSSVQQPGEPLGVSPVDALSEHAYPREEGMQQVPVASPGPIVPRPPRVKWFRIGISAAVATVLVTLTVILVSTSWTYEMGGFITLSAEPPTYETLK